ncbi:saccharopine dehydrogenase NADP-binding domain-containing protein [Robbsia sp. KACC 23696]|uniref:saccharopine dehydrogenase NADP-binding domain-containing protein n=1 Tax=Robbsia sp. KACC 23696 TaxID=3149231 RepID=UPI00325AF6DC
MFAFVSMQSHIVIIGFGSIGQGVVPLLKRQFPDRQILAFDRHIDENQRAIARKTGIALRQQAFSKHTYRDVLTPCVRGGDILLNLATDVSSMDLIVFAQSVGAIYLDTNIEPWEAEQPVDRPISNHLLRERILTLQRRTPGASTAIVAHGANPGFVSVLVKRALLQMASRNGIVHSFDPHSVSRADWAGLAANLGICTIQISENDTQRAAAPFPSEMFVNTWSVSGFITECRQAAEIGYGTHEGPVPDGARQNGADKASVTLKSVGAETWVDSWSPRKGPFAAMVLTHNESLSIADYLTLFCAKGSAMPRYRPTVYYAYRPSDATLRSLAMLDAAKSPGREHVMKAEIEDGIDELGILLISKTLPSYWLGSGLSIADARRRAPYNNATSLQVTSSIVAALRWAMHHPNAGIVESDALPHDSVYDMTAPYWEPIYGATTNWPHRDEVGGMRRLTFSALQRSACIADDAVIAG